MLVYIQPFAGISTVSPAQFQYLSDCLLLVHWYKLNRPPKVDARTVLLSANLDREACQLPTSLRCTRDNRALAIYLLPLRRPLVQLDRCSLSGILPIGFILNVRFVCLFVTLFCFQKVYSVTPLRQRLFKRPTFVPHELLFFHHSPRFLSFTSLCS